MLKVKQAPPEVEGYRSEICSAGPLMPCCTLPPSPQNSPIQQNKLTTLLMYQLSGNPGCSGRNLEASSSNIYPRLKRSGDRNGKMKRRMKTR